MSILRMRRERGGWIARGWSSRGIFMVVGCWEGVDRDGRDVTMGFPLEYLADGFKSDCHISSSKYLRPVSARSLG